jgi:hypothetical protein
MVYHFSLLHLTPTFNATHLCAYCSCTAHSAAAQSYNAIASAAFFVETISHIIKYLACQTVYIACAASRYLHTVAIIALVELIV